MNAARLVPQRLAVAAMLAVASVTTAYAGLVTVNSGDDFFLNVNFGGQTPAPPYDFVVLTFEGTDTTPHQVYLEWYYGQDGTGGRYSFFDTTYTDIFSGSSPFFSSSDAGYADGYSSLRLVGNSGTANWNIYAAAYNNDQEVARIDLTASVPAPATLALFGIGLAGLGFARRRKAQ